MQKLSAQGRKAPRRSSAAAGFAAPGVILAALALGSGSSGGLAQTSTPSINSTSANRVAGPYTPVPVQAYTNDGKHRIIVSNDLGMHCADLDARIASILPPFNVMHAQVLTKAAKPALLNDSSVSVVYSATYNTKDPNAANPPVLATNGSVYKADFWIATAGYAPFYPAGLLAQFFPATPLRIDLGLPVPDVYRLFLGDGALVVNQQTMPSVTAMTIDPVTHVPTAVTRKSYVANAPQPFRVFEKSWPLFKNFVFGYVVNNTNWFAAEGVPVAPFDDIGRENPFPLMRVQAKDKATGATLATLDTVVPVSGETNCKTCHLPSPYGNGLATGRVVDVKAPANDPQFGKVPQWVSEEWAADVNTLELHDTMHGTKLYVGFNATSGLSPKPVVCQTCHYTPALDLTQAGPQAAGGLTQTTHQSMSRVMHNGHGALVVAGQPLFPTMPPPNDPKRVNTSGNPINAFTEATLEATCYQCHPGKRTQCLRGAMFDKAGAVCQDCHGQMTQVGADFSRNLPKGGFIIAADFYKNPATPRVPWLNEPTCGSCHTGDAVSNKTATPGAIKAADSIRLLQAFLSTDPKATPILPTNLRFAEPRVATGAATGNPQLFRLSVDKHGGVFCEGCHGATHAEWPTRNANSNDNLAALEIQGHAGKITECGACHTGVLGATLAGPHGMHPVGNNGNSAAWVRNHGDFAEGAGVTNCKACHGTRGQGTVLAKVAINRAGLPCEGGALCRNGAITLQAGAEVTCTNCHSNPLY